MQTRSQSVANDFLRHIQSSTQRKVSKGIFKTSGNTIASVATVVGISFVLLLVGVLLSLFLMGDALNSHFRGQVLVQLIMNNEAVESEILSFKKRLEGEPYTASVTYISKEEAAEIMQEELGKEFVDFLGYNPLPASLDITLNAGATADEAFENTLREWQQNHLVNEVVYQKDLLQAMNTNLKQWSLALSILGALLLVIAIVIIVVTVQLAVFSQRFIIKSMQLVGATWWFIQRPFLYRSLLLGFISALVALLLLFGFLYFFRQELSYIIEVLRSGQRLLILAGGVIAAGLLISWLATAFAVRRFLRLESSQLY